MEFSASPFSISVSWSISGAMVDSYEVLWDRATPDDCPDEHTGSATVSGTPPRSYNITGLFGDSAYMIRVNATNAAGSAISGPLVVFTEEHGNPLPNYVCNVCSMPFSSSSSSSSHCTACQSDTIRYHSKQFHYTVGEGALSVS